MVLKPVSRLSSVIRLKRIVVVISVMAWVCRDRLLTVAIQVIIWSRVPFHERIKVCRTLNLALLLCLATRLVHLCDLVDDLILLLVIFCLRLFLDVEFLLMRLLWRPRLSAHRLLLLCDFRFPRSVREVRRRVLTRILIFVNTDGRKSFCL